MTDSQDAPKKWGAEPVDEVSADIRQSYPDTCAIRSQEIILRDFGFDVSEDELVRQSMEKGWYAPGHGTSPEDVGNLLEEYGVEVNQYRNANIFTLSAELAQNHKVIIGVDSGELWHKGAWEGFEDFIGLERGDHALLVSGIDTSDTNNVKVILTDPGTGDVAKEYPVEQFMDAWQDSGFFMVATKGPAPAWLPASANFDYELGHLPSFGSWRFGELVEARERVADSFLHGPDTNFEDRQDVIHSIMQEHVPHEPSDEPKFDGWGENDDVEPDIRPSMSDFAENSLDCEHSGTVFEDLDPQAELDAPLGDGNDDPGFASEQSDDSEDFDVP